MNDEEKALEEEIVADAERQAQRLERQAQREADRIKEEAREKAEEEAERTRRRAEERAEQERARAEALIGQEVAATRRRARQQILEEVRDRALQKLRELADDDRYADVLVQLAVRAVDAMEGERFELVLRDEDRERLADDLPGRVAEAVEDQLDRQVELTVSDESLDGSGGLVVRDESGRQMADQTFEGRIERLWSPIRQELIGRLPEVSGGGA
jgi:V/A-type H+-transporting ATPase subunit E